jgi:hypothetical protein
LPKGAFTDIGARNHSCPAGQSPRGGTADVPGTHPARSHRPGDGGLSPLQQLANILSMAAAGFLASTVLRGMHVVIGGVTFGPVDTIIGVSGLLIVAAGLAVIVPLRGADKPAASEPVAAG